MSLETFAEQHTFIMAFEVILKSVARSFIVLILADTSWAESTLSSSDSDLCNAVPCLFINSLQV